MLFTTAAVAALATSSALPRQRNVLYVVSDDLRPELPIYNHSWVIAPHLQRLARSSLVFENAYAQFAICNPSRNSFMTGRRPCDTMTWNDLHSFRDYPLSANWTTLPGVFKASNYTTLGVGKLFHDGQPANGDGARSWTDTPVQWDPFATAPGQYYVPGVAKCNASAGMASGDGNWCPEDVPVSGAGAYFADVNSTDHALRQLSYAVAVRNATGRPFFLGLGLRRPHLDWHYPAPYLRAYGNLSSVPTATNPRPPVGAPDVALTNAFKKATDLFPGGAPSPFNPMPAAVQREVRSHYLASVSFMDAQLGRVLDALDAHGVTNDTLVIFHGDHGWHLGEHGMWKKYSLFECALRVPLVVRAPWLPASVGARTRALVELVDVLPTAAALAGAPLAAATRADSVPPAGADLSALLAQPANASRGKRHAFSQYPRCHDPLSAAPLWSSNGCSGTEPDALKFKFFGYSVRSATWRYTEWRKWDRTRLAPQSWSAPPYARELYAHAGDASSNFSAFENENVAAQPANAAVVAELAAALRAEFEASCTARAPPL
eukprot:g6999.t1